MKQRHILTEPSDQSDRATDEYYDELASDDWLAKSRRLQARRWHKIRSESRHGGHHYSHKGRGIRS